MVSSRFWEHEVAGQKLIARWKHRREQVSVLFLFSLASISVWGLTTYKCVPKNFQRLQTDLNKDQVEHVENLRSSRNSTESYRSRYVHRAPGIRYLIKRLFYFHKRSTEAFGSSKSELVSGWNSFAFLCGYQSNPGTTTSFYWLLLTSTDFHRLPPTWPNILLFLA